MADVVLVHLGLDTSGVVSGEKQATRSLQNIDTAANKATSTLAGMGGPIGRLAGSFSGLTGNASSLVSGLGLLGGAAAVAATSIVALGAAMVKAALDGAKLADEVVTLSNITGVSVETIEELETAYVGVGGSASDARGAISRFSNLLGQAATGEAPQLAKALKALGVTDFSNLEQSLKAVRTTLVQNKDTIQTNALATQLLSKEGARLVEVWRQLEDKGSELNQNMERFGLKLGVGVVEGAAKANNALGLLELKFDQIKKQIAFELSEAITTFGDTFITTLKNLEPVILATARLINALAEPLRAGIPARPQVPAKQQGFTTTAVVGGQTVLVKPGAFPPGFGPQPAKAGEDAVSQALKALLADNKKAGAGRAPKAVREITEFTPEEIGDPFKRGLEIAQREADATAAAIESATLRLRLFAEEWLELLRILSSGVEQLVPPSGSGIPGGGPRAGQIIPGLSASELPPHPSTVRTEQQAALDAQFAQIFDGFLVSILTAQKTVGGAFADLALGVVDQFAIEFTTALRKSFITPVIESLTNMLNEMLTSLFSGLSSGGGAKGFFGGVVKGIGQIFGGIFGGGGTLAPGKFGIAGERGPELIFSGSQPLHIAPVTAGSAGNVININLGVHAPDGSVSKKTQDHMAHEVYMAVQRAQRNTGSR